jgi:glucokinase
MLFKAKLSPCEELLLPAQENRVLVYDVGGSHISAAVFHQQGCTLEGVVSAGYPSEQATETFLDVLASLRDSATKSPSGILGASLAMPGPFDYAAGVSWMQHKLPYLYGFDLRQALAARFGFEPSQVRFLNDAAAYLHGEISAAGAAQGVERVVGITLGTGVGSAFAVDGDVVREGKGVPSGGEIWNFPYEGGILEDRISTRAIQQAYEKRTGQLREVAAIAADAGSDQIAAEVFTEFGKIMGVALHSVLAEFDPQAIVLGGGISRSSHLFLSAAQKEFSNSHAELRVSALGGDAPLVGGGAAWFEDAASTVKAGKT